MVGAGPGTGGTGQGILVGYLSNQVCCPLERVFSGFAAEY